MKNLAPIFRITSFLLISLLLVGCEALKSTPIAGWFTGRTETVAEYLEDVQEENEEHYDEAGPVDEFATVFEDDGEEEYRN